MSFRPELDETYEALQAAGQLAGGGGITVRRIDSLRGDYLISGAILSSIKQSSLIVCDLTFDRPNVYYELGYARGLGKTVIHCAQEGTDVHFDIKDFKTIFYKSPTKLQRKMTKEFQPS